VQEALIRDEKARFEKYRAEQVEQLEFERAEFERYKATQEELIESERAENLRLLALRERHAQAKVPQGPAGRPEAKEAAATDGAVGSDVKCFLHQTRGAVAFCSICGCGVCEMCHTGLGDKNYCPSCLDSYINK
jgi:hypothetical protein